MSSGAARAFTPLRSREPRDGRPIPWRVALLAISLLLSAFVLPPFLGMDAPVAPAWAVVSQGNATGCRAYGINWTSCQNAFLSDDAYAYANGTLVVQFARPDSTISTGDWTAVGAPTHHEAIDEVTPNDDTDYVNKTGLTNPTMEVGTSDVTDPGSASQHTMRFTAKALGSAAVEKMQMDLYQGATLIASTGVQNIDRTAYTPVTYTLTAAEQDSITDYTDLRFRLTVDTLDSTETINVTQAELEVIKLQFARPDSTIQTNGWTVTGAPTHHEATDEITPNGDTDYAETPNADQILELGLSNVTDPQTDETHTMRFTAKAFGVGPTEEMRMDLYQGATFIKSTGPRLIDRTAYEALTQALTVAEADSITDYTDLRFQLTATGLGSGETIRITQAELELPAAAAAGKNDTVWKNFGFALNESDTINTVEIGVEWFRNNTAAILSVTISWDGGTTWATNQTATNKSSDDNAVEFLDFTSATVWNASKLNDSNLRVRVGTYFAGARLDHVTVRTTVNDAPEVTNLRMEDAAGQSLAGGLLDPAVAYHFLFNVTDEDGWVDIGTDGAVGLQMWYDGNVTPEISFAEQTNGINYRIELRYEDIADPGNASLDEWSVVEGGATYNASASSLTAIFNGTTLIGYEFNLSMNLGPFVKAASEPTNTTPGEYNDPDSWNVEAVVFDGSVGVRQPRAAGGEHLEFGVFALALMDYSASASPTTIQPGQSTVFRVDFDNTGQGQASRVWVNVTLPVELTYLGDDAAAIGGVPSCCESFEFTDVDPGSYVFNVTASANGGVANGTVATTSFTYQALDAQGRSINQTAEDVSVTVVTAVMSYAVSASPMTLQPDDTTVFRVDFTNAGEGDAGIVWVNVSLPAELTYVGDDAASIGGSVACCYNYEFTSVTPGTHSFNITARANGGVANGTVAITNFTFEATDPEGAPLPPSAQDVAVTLANAVLTLVVTSSSGLAEPGDALTFTATLENVGAAPAESLTIEGSMDANVTYLFSSPAGTYDALSRVVRWNLASLAPGAQAVFQWTVTVNATGPDGATVLARATAAALDTSGTPLLSPEDSVPVDVVSASFVPVLVMTPLGAERGDEVLASLYYNNTGAGASGTVWINWTLNGHYALVALLPEPLFVTTTNGFDVVLPSVASGTQRLDARLRVIRGLQDNLAMGIEVSFASTYRNGNLLEATDLSAAATLRAPDLALTLTTPSTRVDAGASLLLDLTIRNTGRAGGMGWLNLTLPAGVAYRGDDGTFAVTETADGVSWVLPSLPAGSVIDLVVTLTSASELGLQSFRFAIEFTDGKGSPPASAISNAVSVQIGPGASTPPLPWMWLLLAALVGGLVLFFLTRRLRRPSIEEVFVVHQSGILIAHRSKTLTPDKDEDILAAMLSTVQDFIRDAFSQHEDTPVRGLQFDKFNILVERGTYHYVAVVFQGRDNGALQTRLHLLSDRIEAEFGETLARWQGNMTDVRPVKALLPLLWGRRKARERQARPEAAGVPEEPPEIPAVPTEAESVAPEITESAVRKARKAELRAWCLQLGLSDSGSVAELRERLLHELEAPEEDLVQEPESEPGLDEPPPDQSLEETGTKKPVDEAESIEEEIGSIAEAPELEPEDSPAEFPEAAPEDSPKVEVRTPFIVLEDSAGPSEGGSKRKKAKKGKKGKKEKRGKKDK